MGGDGDDESFKVHRCLSSPKGVAVGLIVLLLRHLLRHASTNPLKLSLRDDDDDDDDEDDAEFDAEPSWRNVGNEVSSMVRAMRRKNGTNHTITCTKYSIH